MHELSFASLTWREAPMPGASPIRMALLPKLGDGAFRAFVRFPPGWARLQRGHYEAAEEFIVLEGELALDERRWQPGGYAWIAPLRLRTHLRSETGCLVFATFSSPPRWIADAPPEPATEADVAYTHWREAPRDAIGHRLREGSWVTEQPPSPCETLGLHSLAWRAPGGAQPAGEPLFARRM
jgi:hypothetical protein